MKDTYAIEVVGLKRELPVCKVSDDLSLAGFVIFGDVEMTVTCARELLKRSPEYDVLITAEAKGIPLAHEIARQSSCSRYIVARKSTKLYMRDIFSAEVQSISTAKEQELFIDGKDAALMKGNRVLIVDDVISTGKSIQAVEHLVEKAGGEVVGRIAILAEGEAKDRDDIITLQYLPLLDGEGNPRG